MLTCSRRWSRVLSGSVHKIFIFFLYFFLKSHTDFKKINFNQISPLKISYWPLLLMQDKYAGVSRFDRYKRMRDMKYHVALSWVNLAFLIFFPFLKVNRTENVFFF